MVIHCCINSVRPCHFRANGLNCSFLLKAHVLPQPLRLLHVLVRLVYSFLKHLLLLSKRILLLLVTPQPPRLRIFNLVLLLLRVCEEGWVYTSLFSLFLNIFILHIVFDVV